MDPLQTSLMNLQYCFGYYKILHSSTNHYLERGNGHAKNMTPSHDGIFFNVVKLQKMFGNKVV